MAVALPIIMSMSTNLSLVLEKLREEESTLAHSVEELDAQHRAAVGDLKRIRSSIAALNGTPASSKPRLPESKVLAYLQQTLTASAPLSAADLQETLLKHAKAEGHSGTGLHLTLRRLLKRSEFESSDEGYRLKS